VNNKKKPIHYLITYLCPKTQELYTLIYYPKGNPTPPETYSNMTIK
jgi:hypothetical protein